MRAALCRTYGGPEVIELAEVPSPPLGPGQVRVRINIGAVNFPDVLVVANTYQVSVPTPFILGSEYAGTVVELGEGADGLELGDRVFGSTIVGAFAEEIVVAPSVLMRIPVGVDDRTAAAFGVAYRTAYHVLRSVAALQRGRGARRPRCRRRCGLGGRAAGRAAGRHGHRRGLDAREARGGRGRSVRSV